MKHIKTLAVIAFFFVVNMTFAQSSAKNWPKLKDVKEVTARINMNIENNNQNAFAFAETLKGQTQQLATSEIPAEFNNKKTQENVKLIAAKAEELNKKALAKAPFAELKAQFNEIQTLINSLTEVKSTK
ncbi:MAG: hypothetical protein EOO50_12285 [Flavobacterium sp.]|uniref:hypothetical protein n=1 Tax=Flavobacterium sp. TaxID=239 RepID=UPI0011F5F8A6|nr:hypothetical protein [Flavobacterium sp.]RZJ65787.1 MAG: hypothetical protein EOO50_12285 [Flavobacterium sp.]